MDLVGLVPDTDNDSTIGTLEDIAIDWVDYDSASKVFAGSDSSFNYLYAPGSRQRYSGAVPMGFAVGWIGATIYFLARDLALIAAVLMMDTIT
jgi:hypothetical protein